MEYASAVQLGFKIAVDGPSHDLPFLNEGIYERQTASKGRDAKLRTFKTSAHRMSTVIRANPG